MARFVFSAFADEAGRSLDEQIRALKENGIDYIEPRNIEGKGIISMSDEEILEIKRKLDENGIKVNSLGSPIGKYKIEDDFEPHLKDTIRALEICNMLETKNMRMFSFFTTQDELSKYRDVVMRRLNVMANEAEKYGVDTDDVETYMMDDIDFDARELPFGAESCGCYINGQMV